MSGFTPNIGRNQEGLAKEFVGEGGAQMLLVRQEIGDVLRDVRQRKGHTLRQVASRASVALGYLSEVERGQKEASSEILASVAEALEVPISTIMREVADRLAMSEGVSVGSAVTV
ncbi:MAG: helix-turn-helix transcriptional regulator, partial [Actinomycetales bacterium]|nr:helix-turn-helix transcriptional regulator [Actinomycetales bacterium]